MSRVVVVGAGVGGLAATVRLAARGHDVTLLEAAPDVGGKLGTEVVDGFVFDTGPSLVTMPHVLEDLYAATGAPLADVLDLRRLDPACRYTFPDGAVLDLPGRLEDIPAALDDVLGPGRGAQWQALLTRAEQVWDLTHEPFLESPVGPADLARVGGSPRDLAALAPWRSLRSLGASYLTDPRLRLLLDRYATYTGSDPRRAPSALVSVPWAEQAWGSWYVEGGLGRIAATLVERAVGLGVEVRTSTEVAEVLVEGGRAVGVLTAAGERIAADVVVANADAAHLYGAMLPGSPRVAARAARRTRWTTPSLSGFVLLLALDDPPAGPHHRVLFAEDYDAEMDGVFGVPGRLGRLGRPGRPGHGGALPRPPDRPTVYVSAPDDAAMVPEPGTGAWFVLVNAPRHSPGQVDGPGIDWDEPGLAASYADRVLALMAERGLEVRDRIRHRRVITPADLARRTLTPGGSIYGTSSNGARAAFLRPGNRSPVPGLFLVGGSSHPGGGLPLVTLSARIVADLVGPA